MKKSMPMPQNEHSSVSVDVRKIENGYIVRKSISDAKGYRSEECYSPTKPTFEVRAAGGAGRGKGHGASRSSSGSLGKAMTKLKE